MNVEHFIKFYPVDNGDNTLIKLHNGITIITDCQMRSTGKNSDDIEIFNVKKDLISELNKDSNGIPYVDLFILTHPHQDHCLGFETNFHVGSIDSYNDKNKEKIIIGELWVTQKVFSNDFSGNANVIRAEANRRIRVFNENRNNSNIEGNHIRIIGYNSDDKTVDGLHYVPGQTINIFNGKASEYLDLFIHSPFKDSLKLSTADNDENIGSVVYQAQFRIEKSGDVEAAVFIAGDADHYVFEKIIEVTEQNNKKEKLEWDLFLAPHHCSWSFFNDTQGEDKEEAVESSTKFLNYKTKNGIIVTSSKVIKDNDNNPPSYKAKKEYIKSVGEENFYNTSSNEDVKCPKPLKFKIAKGGITKVIGTKTGSSAIVSNTIPRAGK